MYGTIARFRIKPGVKDNFIKTMDSFGKEIYVANANSIQQHEQYLKFRSFLMDDPEWNDDFILSAIGPGLGK